MYRHMIALLTVLAMAGAALAEDFLSYDTDADGYLSAREMATLEAFDAGAADRDGDGLIDPSEFEAMMARRVTTGLDEAPVSETVD